MSAKRSTRAFWLVACGVVICIAWAVPAQAATIVHRYDFENEDGTDSVSGVDGDVIGAPFFSDDAISGEVSLELQGDQYVRVEDAMDFGPQFSIAMWIQPDPTALGIQNLIGNAPGGWDTDGFKLYYNTWSDPATADGAYILETGDGVDVGSAGNAVRTAGGILSEGVWYQVATTVDLDAGEALLYVDGLFEAITGGLNIDMKTDSPFEIGSMIGDWDLHGIVDDVQIYEGILTEEEVEYLFNNPGQVIGEVTVPGDFDGDGDLTVADIDLLTAAAVAGDDPAYDLNGDNLVDVDDVNIWVKDLKKTWIGDADVNMAFDSSDFVQVFTVGAYETDQPAVWSEGDWDATGFFDSSDFVAAFVDGGYELETPPDAVRAVPEPNTLLLILFGLVALVNVIRRRG